MNGSSILVVDDSPLILNVVANLLQNAGYQIHKSENGKEAIKVLENQEVDLILCDIMMPEMNGWDLHRYVRCKENLNHVPFVFLTSVNEQSEINQAKREGADDYFLKPFNPNDLLNMIEGKVVRSKMVKSSMQQQVDKVKKNMIQSVSHELRTPLVAIKAGTEMLLQGEVPDDAHTRKEILKAIARGGERLESFVDDIVTMQQFEGTKIKATLDKCYPEQVIREMLSCQTQVLKNAGFHVRTDLDSTLTINISPEHFLEIYKRLLVNAIKFSRQRKVLKIRFYQEAGKAKLEVCDRGIGIGDNQAKHALNAFVQFDRERHEQQGVGLGLAIANYYANLYGATLELSKRPKGGTKATVVFDSH